MTAMEAGDMSTACRRGALYGADPDERRQMKRTIGTLVDGEVWFGRIPDGPEADIWRFEYEVRSLPEGATIAAGLPTLALRGEYELTNVGRDDETIESLLGEPAAVPTLASRLESDCQPEQRPEPVNAQVWVPGMPLLRRATGGRLGTRGRHREPTSAERAERTRMLEAWERRNTERLSRCADAIATAERSVESERAEAVATREDARAAFQRMLTPTPGCPELTDEPVELPVGVRCVYHLNAEQTDTQSHPTYVRFSWTAALRFPDCQLRRPVFGNSRAHSLEDGVREIFPAALPLGHPTAWN